jgi:putative ABC transport system ATP-binding protein
VDAVVLKAVKKTFHSGDVSTLALRGIDLTVKRGELLMLMGPSGCGKTTLISIIAAILNADSGSCEVLGHSLARMSERERTRFRGREVGFIFQAFNLLPTLSVLENVSIPLLLNGKSRKQAQARAHALLEQVGLAQKVNALPQDLSGGQQQRVAIARALVHNPMLIVADEPTSALDHKNGELIMQLFRDTALAENRSLIIVTHDARITQYADRVAHMDDGTLLDMQIVPKTTTL